MKAYDLTIFADYFQFYLWDAGVRPGAPVDYVEEDLIRRVKVEENVVVVQPVRNMDVPVRIELHDADPGCDLDDWDHVVECSLHLPTGQLQVHECTGEARLDLAVAAGVYRVRALFAGLDTLLESGLEGDDRYVVALWPGDATPLRVVKQSPITWAG